MEEEGFNIDTEDANDDMISDIIAYLDASGHLENLLAYGKAYRETILEIWQERKEYGRPFKFVASVNILKMTEVSSELGAMLLHNPKTLREMFRGVVHRFIVQMCELPFMTLDHIQVILRVDTLPAMFGFIWKRSDFFLPSLRLLQGVMAAFTVPTKYTCSAEFRCSSPACPGYVSQRLYGAEISQPSCHFCDRALDEITRGRDVGDQVFGLLLDMKAVHPPERQGITVHPVTIRFTDELCRNLELGARYDVVVMPGKLSLEAWGVQLWESEAERRVRLGFTSNPLPPSVQHILIQVSTDHPMSPWAFIVALSMQLGEDGYPGFAYLHLKVGVLLSLASFGLGCPPVGLVALGPDPAGARLLNWSSRLATRVVRGSGASAVLSGDAFRAAPAPHVPWQCAGSLALARGGVYFLGNWSKSNTTNSIKAALESGRTTEDGTSGQSLECAVWTCFTPQNTQSGRVQLRTILKVLGVPVLSEPGCEEESVSQYLLEMAVGERHDFLPREQIAEFLELVNAQPVAITEEATSLIQDYFVASRRVRQDCLPPSAVATMVAMSKAAARLRLQREANCSDVVLVVWLYEIALNSLYGANLIVPLPEDCNSPLHFLHVPRQMDERLCEMHSWLNNFTKSVLLSSLSVQ